MGVYSGKERLGEGYGASGDEARIKAAVNALKSWYLYSPVEPGDVPSVTMGGGKKEGGRYRPAFVDVGEIVV